MSTSIAKAVHRNLRVTPSKLNLVASLIRKMPVAEALLQLQFSKKRISREVKKCLESAIANAENNHNLDVSSLVIDEILIGKAMVMKRMMPRARGRADRINKFSSHLEIRLREIKD